MHPSISFFPNSSFYDNLILDAPNVRKKSYEKHYLPGAMFGPYSFANVNDGREEKDEDGHSRKNMVEVAIVLKLLRNLYKGMSGWRLISVFSSFWFSNGFFLCFI
jgi:superfamily I DNA and/or RNA helicase